MSNPRKEDQALRLTRLLEEYVAVEAKLEAARVRHEELRDLIRVRLLRRMSCVGYKGRARLEDLAIELAQDFPAVRTILGFRTFKEAAQWIMEGNR